jgi:hypothetical protein
MSNETTCEGCPELQKGCNHAKSVDDGINEFWPKPGPECPLVKGLSQMNDTDSKIDAMFEEIRNVVDAETTRYSALKKKFDDNWQELNMLRNLSKIKPTKCGICGILKWCPWRDDKAGYICAGCLAEIGTQESKEKYLVKKELDEIRNIFPEILKALGSGCCTNTVSVSFLKDIPGEVKLIVDKLKKEKAEANAKVEAWQSTSKILADTNQRLETQTLQGKKETEESGSELITKERKRQIEVEGWTAEHDDIHNVKELARAG